MTLELGARDKGARARDLLASSLIPCEFYGKGVENMSLQVDYQTFRKVFRVAGTNMILALKVEGKDPVNALVHEIQYDPVTDMIKHIDFMNVRMGETLHTKIPVELVGVAPAVKELGGMLMHHLNEIEVKCLPKDLIHKIEVNIESLVDFHVAIKVQDLKVPSTLEVLNDPEDMVVTAIAPRVEEESDETAETAEAAEGDAKVEDTKEGEGESSA